MVQKGTMMPQYISTKKKIVEILTKPLSKGKFVYFRDKLIGVMDNASLSELGIFDECATRDEQADIHER